MGYVEFLRVRKSLGWHAGILAVLTLLILYFAPNTTIEVGGGTKLLAGIPVPLGQLAEIAMFFGAIYASSAGTSLNRENLTRDLSWTKPESRTLIAVKFVLIDVAGVVLAFAFAMLMIVAILLRLHVMAVADASLVPQLVLGLGVGVMWYALVELLTCSLGSGARAIGGLLWPVSLVLLGLSGIGGTLGLIARILNVFNPLAYMEGVGSHAGGGQQSISPLPLELRALTVWVLAAVFCALAVALWPRKEA